jgi:hypothetical protein
VKFSANRRSITSGQSLTLSWSSTNATSVTINPGIGKVGTSGSRTVKPTTSVTYSAVAEGAGGKSAPAYIPITVNGVAPVIPGTNIRPGTSTANLLKRINIKLSVPYLAGNMTIKVKLERTEKEIEISPSQSTYSVDLGSGYALKKKRNLFITGDKILAKTISFTPGRNNVDVNVGTLILGDLNHDNAIDDTDKQALIESITSQTSVGDLNSDGVPNSIDWAILLTNLGQKVR